MKRVMLLITALALLLPLASCSKAEAPLTAAELLDLGEKFLLELDYEQAIVYFTKLIEIEPKNSRAYIGAAEAYAALGRTDEAIAILDEGLAQLPDNVDISAMLEALRPPEPMPTPESTPTPIETPTLTPEETPTPTPTSTPEPTASIPQLSAMPSIEFSIDGIVLGETDISEVKSKYSSRADYMSNIMGGYAGPNTDDTVYSMPYMYDNNSDNDMNFGYFFSQPLTGDSIEMMSTRESSMLLMGKYHIGDDILVLLADLCGIKDLSTIPIGEHILYDDNGEKLTVSKYGDEYSVSATSLGGKHIIIYTADNKIDNVSMFTDNAQMTPFA
jgi:tetratricopeptide (TPR) repeat protein